MAMIRNAVTLALLSSIAFAAAADAGAAAPKEKASRLKPESKAMLLAIHGADHTVGHKIDLTTEAAKDLAKRDFILTDNTKREGDLVPAILSESGKAKVATYKEKEATPRTQLTPDDFELEDNVPMPDFSATRRAARQIYPFDKMQPGQSFFIPIPEGFKGDDFAKSKVGTIGAQNRKAKEAFDALPADERPEKCPKWRVVNDAKGETKGARVFREA